MGEWAHRLAALAGFEQVGMLRIDAPASPDLAPFCQDADLLIVHCAGSDQDPKPGHASLRQVGNLAAQAVAGSPPDGHTVLFTGANSAITQMFFNAAHSAWSSRGRLGADPATASMAATRSRVSG